MEKRLSKELERVQESTSSKQGTFGSDTRRCASFIDPGDEQ